MNKLRDAMTAAYYALAAGLVLWAVRAELRDGLAAQRAAIDARRKVVESRTETMRNRLPFYRSIRADLMREEGL